MAKKFARIIGMSSLFEVGQDNKYDITHIKDSVADVDNYTICFITTTEQDAAAGYYGGQNFVWTRGKIYGKSFIPVTSVEVSPKEVTIVRQNKVALGFADIEAIIKPEHADITGVTWSSSNTKVCLLEPDTNDSRFVRLLGTNDGECDITATTVDSEYTDTCHVVVTHTQAPVETVNIIEGEQVNLTRPDSETPISGTLHCQVLPDSAEITTVNWESSDDVHCKITGVGYNTHTVNFTVDADGEYLIQCTSTFTPEVSAFCTIIVDHNVILPTEIWIEPKSMEIVQGFTNPIRITVTPNNVDDNSVVWSSSDPSIATVVDTGSEYVVNGLSAGTATVTATSVASPDVSASCEVTVVNPTIIPSVNDLGINDLGPESFQYGSYAAGRESFFGSWDMAAAGGIPVSGRYNKTNRALGNFTYDMDILFEDSVTTYLEFLESSNLGQYVQLGDNELPTDGYYILAGHQHASEASNYDLLQPFSILQATPVSDWGPNAFENNPTLANGVVCKYNSAADKYYLDCTPEGLAELERVAQVYIEINPDDPTKSQMCVYIVKTAETNVFLSYTAGKNGYGTGETKTWYQYVKPSSMSYSTDSIKNRVGVIGYTNNTKCLCANSQSTGYNYKYRFYSMSTPAGSSGYLGVRLFKKVNPGYMGYGRSGSYSPTSLTITPTIQNHLYDRVVLGLEINGNFTVNLKNEGTIVGSQTMSSSGDVSFDLSTSYQTDDMSIEIVTSSPLDQTLGLRSFTLTQTNA